MTVIYKLNDGRVQGISSGIYTDEEFLEAYGDEYGKIETDNLLQINPLRQYLAVEDGELVIKDEILSEEQEAQVERIEASNEITELKAFLANTDYHVIKCYDLGLVYQETYPDEAQKRQKARDRINELERL